MTTNDNIDKKVAQPYRYPLEREFVEPDWRRIPAFRDVSAEEWRSALWQRKHTIKNIKELKNTLGNLLPDAVAEDFERISVNVPRCRFSSHRKC